MAGLGYIFEGTLGGSLEKGYVPGVEETVMGLAFWGREAWIEAEGLLRGKVWETLEIVLGFGRIKR